MNATEGESWWVRPVAGALSSQTAEFCTYPIDTSKTRLQMSGKGGSVARYSGMFDAIYKISKEEGVTTLYRGFSAAFLRQGVYRSLVFAMYEPLRDGLDKLNLTKAGEGSSASSLLVARIISGGTAGCLGGALVNPIDVVKVRMQANSPIYKYTNVFSGLYDVCVREGFHGMTRGIVPTMQRAFLVNAAELATYDTAKSHIAKIFGDGITTSFLASVAAGFTAAVVSAPVDLIKTRLMNQTVDPVTGRGTEYKGMWDVTMKVVKSEGVLSLYKGFIPTWLRLGPYTLIAFMTFEQYRKGMNDLSAKY